MSWTDAASSAASCCQRCSLRSALIRLPTVSALGLSLSCGSVSQAGNSTTLALGVTLASASRSDSESRPVATMASNALGRPLGSEKSGQKWRAQPVDEGKVGVAAGICEGFFDRLGARERRD